MKLVRGVLPVVVAVLSALFAVASAHARTPTPTDTPAATATPTATPTLSPQQFARFTGEKWADAAPSSDRVTAKIGNVVCGREEVFACADCAPAYRINVVSDQVTPGCGHEGAIINFFVGNRQAPQTAAWHAGSSNTLNLIVGPPFALISGSTSLTCDQIIEHHIVPFMNGTACGDENFGDALGPPCNGQLVSYQDIVLSAQQQAGCGVEGAPITFKLLDTHGNVIATANEKGMWHAWGGGVSDSQQLNLTFGPAIRVGNTGDGPDGGANPWLRLSVALASLGLASGIGGLAMRRRVAK